MYNKVIIPATGIGIFGVYVGSCYGWTQTLNSILLGIMTVLLVLLLRQVYRQGKGEKQLTKHNK